MTKKEAEANVGKIVVSSYGRTFHECIIIQVNKDRTATVNCNVDGARPGCGNWDIEYKRLMEVTR